MDFSELTGLLDRMPSYDIPAADCVICHKRKIVYRHMTGWADIEEKKPITENTLYNLYSASKVATCTAALTLFDKGLYQLDDPVSEYLPEFKTLYVKPEGAEYARKAKNIMTVRHLFTMSGGLTYDLNDPAIEKVKNKKEEGTTLDFVRAMAQMPLAFEPGTHFRYSLCHDVLGGLIEVWSGMSFENYLKKTILEPVGMNDTTFFRTGENLSRMAFQYHQYRHETGNYEKKDKENPFLFSSIYQSGGAGLVSSVDDYGAFAEMLSAGGITQTGERILKKETVDLMRTDQLKDERHAEFAALIRPGYSYGLGVRTLIDPSKDHNGIR